jgi:hypothetical protein
MHDVGQYTEEKTILKNSIFDAHFFMRQSAYKKNLE